MNLLQMEHLVMISLISSGVVFLLANGECSLESTVILSQIVSSKLPAIADFLKSFSFEG